MIYEYFGAVRKLLTACCDNDDISLALLKNSKLCEKLFSSITNIIKQKVVFLCMPKKAFIAFRKNSVSYFLTGVCSTGGHLTYSMVISPLYKRFTISNHIKAPTMRILSTC